MNLIKANPSHSKSRGTNGAPHNPTRQPPDPDPDPHRRSQLSATSPKSSLGQPWDKFAARSMGKDQL